MIDVFLSGDWYLGATLNHHLRKLNPLFYLMRKSESAFQLKVQYYRITGELLQQTYFTKYLPINEVRNVWEYH